MPFDHDHSIIEVPITTIIIGTLMLVWMDGYAEMTKTVPGSILTLDVTTGNLACIL